MYSEKNLPKVLTPQHRIRIRVLLVESPKPYPWATALYVVSIVEIHQPYASSGHPTALPDFS